MSRNVLAPRCAPFSAIGLVGRARGGVIPHYVDEHKGTDPPRYDLKRLHRPERPICLYGHFGHARGLNIAARYPDQRQFMTILRDPFEQALSNYFFLKKDSPNWRREIALPASAEAFLLGQKLTFLQHFPRDLTRDNYREVIESMFIEVGIAERLPETLVRFAQKLGKTVAPAHHRRLNSTPRDPAALPADPDALRAQHQDANPLEYEVYDYALRRFEAPSLSSSPAAD